jgi:membrane fusion protein (multidrug efflux system)
VHPSPGKMVFVDRNVDATTGTIMGEAAFANPGEILRPGQYVRVRATVESLAGAILVPQRAVREQQGVTSVMVLGAGDIVEQRIVTAAERQGSLWVIRSGLNAGDKVVVDGLQKIRPKDKVNAQVVSAEEAEKPAAPEEKKDGEAPAAPEPKPEGHKAAAPEEKSHGDQSAPPK